MVALAGAPPVPLAVSGSPEGNGWGVGQGHPILPPLHVKVMTPRSFVPSFGSLQKLEEPFVPTSEENVGWGVFWCVKT